MNSFKPYNVLFYLRTDRKISQTEVPIYMRITVNGQRAEISTKRYIDPDKWDTKSNKAKGYKTEIKQLNQYLDNLKTSLNEFHSEMIKLGEYVSAQNLKNKFLGISDNHKTLIEVFKYHNQNLKELEGSTYAPATVKRYETTLMHVKAFLKSKYKIEDIPINHIKYSFVTDFEHYFKVEKKCNHNTTVKYIKNFRKVINLAIKNEWLVKDPFAKFQVKIREVKRIYLNNEELEKIEAKKIFIPRLEIVRDIFVFCCYTGLSYVDVAKLKKDDIRRGIDGEFWLFTERTKTKNQSNIPLLPKPLALVKKYEDHPFNKSGENVFPVASNQKLNAYLKELADLCNITKNLTFHIARHTFATTVTLANGIPIETISSMLGHKNIRTTQIYSKVVQTKVSSDMKKLKKKIS